MNLIETELEGVLIIEPNQFVDDRGWFMESFNEPMFHEKLKALNNPVPGPFIQDNHSSSKKNVLRGLHYQLAPHAQGKLVRVVKGAAYDVVVDIRRGSKNYGQWFGLELSAKNNKMLWIPEGFAHGFMALEDDTNFLYKTTELYCPEFERSIRWDDPEIGIKWPDNKGLLIGKKDQSAPLLSCAETPSMSLSGSVELIRLDIHGDHRGSLVALEQGANIPFEVKRAYYIFDTKNGVSRGYHAHYCLQQYVVCIAGKCRIVTDDGITRESTWLDSPTKALLIKNLIWREMHDFSEGCVLLVFASHHYNESDYIRDYEDFKKAVTLYA